jgi:hypothetical protein
MKLRSHSSRKTLTRTSVYYPATQLGTGARSQLDAGGHVHVVAAAAAHQHLGQLVRLVALFVKYTHDATQK